VQTCSRCNTETPDTITACLTCHADLREFSTTALALKHMQTNPRVNAVVVVVHGDACPACQEIQGTYAKDQAPKLPVEGCSHHEGCRCFYQPVLGKLFP
jgi:hypothetical protein